MNFSSLTYDSRDFVVYARNADNTAGTATIVGLGGATVASFAVQGSYSVGDFVLSADAQSRLKVGYSPGLRYFAPSDFNGDGRADILWRNVNADDVQVWTSQGGASPSFYTQDLGVVGQDWLVAGRSG